MPTVKFGDVDVELREMTEGHYVVLVSHSKFGQLYEIQIDKFDSDSLVQGIEIECIDRINNVSLDLNTLEDV